MEHRLILWECVHTNTLKVVYIPAYFKYTFYIMDMIYKEYLTFIVYSCKIFNINIGKRNKTVKVKTEFNYLKYMKTGPLLPP